MSLRRGLKVEAHYSALCSPGGAMSGACRPSDTESVCYLKQGRVVLALAFADAFEVTGDDL
jgi:hypothetical protein